MKTLTFRWFPTGLFIFGLISLLSSLIPSKPDTTFNINDFGRLPVLNGGRLKPLDTIARTSLLILRGHQTLPVAGRTLSATEWLIDMLYRPEQADTYPVFEIDDPDVLGAMALQQTGNRYYTFMELQPHLTDIDAQAAQAQRVRTEQRSRYQTAITNLQRRLVLYQKLENTLQLAGVPNQGLLQLQQIQEHKASAEWIDQAHFLIGAAEFFPLPDPAAHGDPARWASLGDGLLQALETGAIHPGLVAYAAMGDATRVGNAGVFNQALGDYRRWLGLHAPHSLSHANAEFIFNYVAPFYQSLLLYVIVFLLIFVSWLAWPQLLNRSAFALLLLAFGVHTLGLIARMILQGRPPVTNLYSSAIFVGWVAVFLGIILERLYRNGIGSLVASTIGFITLIIAHHLAASGDTLEMMRAVLDSNFWLATHVVCITVGYGSTFLSGFLATYFILRRRFDSRWSESLSITLERMVYGIVCFSVFFSFLGTILGGIWADQSWGRFWGWDPKENGALLIVLWNTMILHARWGNRLSRHSLMVMAVFGNVVTACSWFGVNMLGIGLHSYGFMQKTFVWLLVFASVQFLVMGLGLLSPRSRPKLAKIKHTGKGGTL